MCPRDGWSRALALSLDLTVFRASHVAQWVKNPAASAGDVGSIPGSAEIPWRRAWQPTPVFLPGESPRTEEPAGGCSPRGCRESDTTEATEHTGTVTLLRCPSLHHPSTVTTLEGRGASHVVSPGSCLRCNARLLCLALPLTTSQLSHPHLPFFCNPLAQASRHRTIYYGLGASCVSPSVPPRTDENTRKLRTTGTLSPDE